MAIVRYSGNSIRLISPPSRLYGKGSEIIAKGFHGNAVTELVGDHIALNAGWKDANAVRFAGTRTQINLLGQENPKWLPKLTPICTR